MTLMTTPVLALSRSLGLVLAVVLGPLACDREDDDGSGEDANDSAMTDDGEDGDETPATDGGEAGDETPGGDEDTGTNTSTSTSTSTTTSTSAGDDGSSACESFFDCPTIVCECPDGSTVETASCIDGTCATADTCADPPFDACE